MDLIAIIDAQDVALFGFLILFVFILLLCLCVVGVWLTRLKDSTSPYTRTVLRRGAELPYDAVEKILRFLFYLHQYDNRMFDLRKAAVCRETGRIFSDALTWYNTLRVDWSFLQKRYPGTYVSWGSLTKEEQETIRSKHASLEGFETTFSSPKPNPSLLDAKYAFSKPGPLYVDLETFVLLGWKCIPDTDFEVLIVQKPLNVIMTTVT